LIKKDGVMWNSPFYMLYDPTILRPRKPGKSCWLKLRPSEYTDDGR
jgi:hypothetical protein